MFITFERNMIRMDLIISEHKLASRLQSADPLENIRSKTQSNFKDNAPLRTDAQTKQLTQNIEQKTFSSRQDKELLQNIVVQPQLELKDLVKNMSPKDLFELVKNKPNQFTEEVILSLSKEQLIYLSDRERMEEFKDKNRELMLMAKQNLPLKSTSVAKKAILAVNLAQLVNPINNMLEQPETQKIMLKMVCDNSMDWGNSGPSWSNLLKPFINSSEGLHSKMLNIFRIKKFKDKLIKDGVLTNTDDFVRKLVFIPKDLYKQEELPQIAKDIAKVMSCVLQTPVGYFEVLK